MLGDRLGDQAVFERTREYRGGRASSGYERDNGSHPNQETNMKNSKRNDENKKQEDVTTRLTVSCRSTRNAAGDGRRRRLPHRGLLGSRPKIVVGIWS